MNWQLWTAGGDRIKTFSRTHSNSPANFPGYLDPDQAIRYCSCMTSDIRKMLSAVPFTPFQIYTADGREYAIPTPDHAHVHPNGSRVTIFSNEGFEATLPALLISGIKTMAPTGE